MRFYFPALITQGGFSSERVYQVETDQGAVVSCCDSQYVRDLKWQPVGRIERDRALRGFVECRRIVRSDKREGMAFVEFATIPGDYTTAWVDERKLTQEPTPTGEAKGAT